MDVLYMLVSINKNILIWLKKRNHDLLPAFCF